MSYLLKTLENNGLKPKDFEDFFKYADNEFEGQISYFIANMEIIINNYYLIK